jgi:hypothetical protein
MKIPEALTSSELCTNMSEGRVTPLGAIFVWLQNIIELMMTKSSKRQKLNNIWWRNRIPTF